MVLSANISAMSDAAGGPFIIENQPMPAGRRAWAISPTLKQQAGAHHNGSGSSEASQAATPSLGAPLRFEHQTMRWVVVGPHGAGARVRRARRGAVLCRSLGTPATNAIQKYMDQNTQLFVGPARTLR